MNVQTIIGAKGTDVITIKPDATIHDCMDVLVPKKIGAVVVSADGSSIDGIISERDIVRSVDADGADALTSPVSDSMTAEVITCTPHDGVDRLMELMTDRRIRHLPVADEDGKLVGIVSIGDVVKARLAQLELENQAMASYIAGH